MITHNVVTDNEPRIPATSGRTDTAGFRRPGWLLKRIYTIVPAANFDIIVTTLEMLRKAELVWICSTSRVAECRIFRGGGGGGWLNNSGLEWPSIYQVQHYLPMCPHTCSAVNAVQLYRSGVRCNSRSKHKEHVFYFVFSETGHGRKRHKHHRILRSTSRSTDQSAGNVGTN